MLVNFLTKILTNIFSILMLISYSVAIITSVQIIKPLSRKFGSICSPAYM